MSPARRFVACCFVLMLFTAGCTSGTGPTSQTDADPNKPPPPGKILFRDDFSSDKNKWTVLEPKAGTARVEQGKLTLVPDLQFQESPILAVAAAQKEKKIKDVTVEAHVSFNPTQDNEEAGLVCRADGLDRRYAFTLGRFGNYDVGYRDKDKSRGLSYGVHKAIRRAPEVNKVRADCHGDVLSMWVNNQLVARVQDSTILSPGFAGVRSTWLHQRAPAAGAHVDNFTVRSLAGRKPVVHRPKVVKPSGSIIHENSFATPEWLGGKVTMEGPNFQVSFVSEKLQIRVSENSGATVDSSQVTDSSGAPLKDLSDVSAETRVAVIEGSERATAGMWCRRPDPAVQRYYSALVYPGLQEFAIVRWDLPEGQPAPQAVFLRGGYTRHLKQGTAANLFRLECIGDQINVYINDALVGSVQDATYTGGSIGLFAEASDNQVTVAQFDEIKVRKPDPKATPTSTVTGTSRGGTPSPSRTPTRRTSPSPGASPAR